MGQWISQIRKTNNHYQSVDQLKTYNKLDLKEIQSFKIGNDYYLIPPSLIFNDSIVSDKFIDPVPDKNTGGGIIVNGNIDFSKLKSYNSYRSKYTGKNMYIYRGVFDYDKGPMKIYSNVKYAQTDTRPVNLVFMNKLGFTYTLEGDTRDIYHYTVLPIIHRVAIISAWINEGYENLLPDIIKNFPDGDDYMGETFTLDGNPYEPNSGILSGNYTHIASNGIISAARIYPDVFTKTIKINPSWIINEPETDLDKYPSCNGYYTKDLSFDNGDYVQGGICSSSLSYVTSSYNYQSCGKTAFYGVAKFGSYVINENIDIDKGIFRYTRYDDVSGSIENLSYKKLYDESGNQVGCIYFTIDNIVEGFVNGGLQKIFTIIKQ